MALTLSIGVLNFLNFSIPGLFMVGGMTVWALIRAGIPLPLAMIGALMLAAAVSLLVERFTWRLDADGVAVRATGVVDGISAAV